jgi:hypothetical protein
MELKKLVDEAGKRGFRLEAWIANDGVINEEQSCVAKDKDGCWHVCENYGQYMTEGTCEVPAVEPSRCPKKDEFWE